MKHSIFSLDVLRPSVLLAPRSKIFRSVIMGSVFIMAAHSVFHPAFANKNTQVTANSPQAKVQKRNAEHVALFQQAINDDLAGRNASARKVYDTLAGTEMATQIAVPLAINLVALGQFDAADEAFGVIATSDNARERDYAHLWQLWLTARTYVGKPTALKKELAILASGMNVSSAGQQALVRLYEGKGSTDAVYAAIAAMPGTDELQRRDALTEATFFIGGYQQYVARDNKAALELYEREQNQLNSTSLERPLINKAAATLQAAQH